MLLLEIQTRKNGTCKTCEQVGMLDGNYIVYHNNGNMEYVNDCFNYLKSMFTDLQLYQFIKVVKEHARIKLQDNYYLVNVL